MPSGGGEVRCGLCGRIFYPMGPSGDCPYCVGRPAPIAAAVTPEPAPATPPGTKLDEGKLRWDLLPLGPVREVVRVLTWALRPKPEGPGYQANNWQLVEDARNRYYAAALRHLSDWRLGELRAPDSKLPHLAHAACCLLFLLWFDARGERAVDEAELPPVKFP